MSEAPDRPTGARVVLRHDGAVYHPDFGDISQDSSDGPSYQVSSFTVYPSGFDRIAVPQKHHYTLNVVDGGDGWAVRWRSRCLNFREEWEFEPPPKSRTPEFLRRCRFNQYAALHRAKNAVDELVVNGLTFDEFVEKVKAEAAEKARVVVATQQQRLRLLDDDITRS